MHGLSPRFLRACTWVSISDWLCTTPYPVAQQHRATYIANDIAKHVEHDGGQHPHDLCGLSPLIVLLPVAIVGVVAVCMAKPGACHAPDVANASVLCWQNRRGFFLTTAWVSGDNGTCNTLCDLGYVASVSLLTCKGSIFEPTIAECTPCMDIDPGCTYYDGRGVSHCGLYDSYPMSGGLAISGGPAAQVCCACGGGTRVQ